ncbi:MAG: MFS transporter [Clostridia bacterium]|nr:MFS transporter [Clostridia bacterium]
MHSLDKRWKELLFAANSFGPNLLFVLLGAYLTDAINPIGLTANKESWSLTGYCLVVPVMFGITWALAKVFDGLVDIPLAHLTDNIRTRWGRRRPMFVISLVPQIISFISVWTPLEFRENSLLNTLWIGLMLLIYYSSYTLSMITFFGSSSSICKDEAQRVRVGNYKSFFDTIGYCIVYALLPIFIGNGINIRVVAFAGLPLMLTLLIPLFLIKEGETYGQGKDYLPEARVPLKDSLRLTLRNRLFWTWVIPNACAYFGLNMFLTSQNALISGVMNLSASYAAIMNTCAFAPVPIMLFIYYKLIQKKGIRFSYRVALASFAVSILNFCVGSEYLFPENITARIVIGCVGGFFGSFGIGAFFATPFMVPAQIAAMEFKATGKDHTAMYFAIQSLATSIMAAISTGLVYEQVKNIVAPKVINGVVLEGETWKVGASLVPAILCFMCIIGFIVAGKMPKQYSEEVVSKEMERIESKRKK